MAILERATQRIKSGKTIDDVRAIESKFDALEAKMGGVPPKRRYWLWYSSHTVGTFVWEREWKSMAELDAYHQKTLSDPEWAAVLAENAWEDVHFELGITW